MLNRTMDNQSYVIAGSKNLQKMEKLNNEGNVKRLLWSYLKKSQDPSSNLNYDKREFIPFKEERDQIGRLINYENSVTQQNIGSESCQPSQQKASFQCSITQSAPPMSRNIKNLFENKQINGWNSLAQSRKNGKRSNQLEIPDVQTSIVDTNSMGFMIPQSLISFSPNSQRYNQIMRDQALMNRTYSFQRQMTAIKNRRHYTRKDIQEAQQSQCDPITSLMIQNIKRKVGTAIFKSSVDRQHSKAQQQKITKFKIPPPGFYDLKFDVLDPKKDHTLNLSKSLGRQKAKHDDQYLRYQSLLDQFDYSSFKHIHGSPDFSKQQQRDDVSFLKQLAKYQMASQLQMNIEDFETLWKSDKAEVQKRLLMVKKS